GQTYDVKAFPSIVTSTRRASSFGVTFTWAEAIAPPRPAATSPAINSLRIHLASRHHLLRLLVERNLHPRLDRRHVHAQRDRVAIAGLDARVRRLAAP